MRKGSEASKKTGRGKKLANKDNPPPPRKQKEKKVLPRPEVVVIRQKEGGSYADVFVTMRDKVNIQSIRVTITS